MEQDKYYFRVGLFVTIMIAIIIFVLGVFSTNRQQDIYITYAIYFDSSVNGLSLGSPVKYKGIDVGKVKSIEFDSYQNDFIRVLVDIVDTAPIRQDTQASLQLQGITGTSIISLEDTNDKDAPIVYLSKEEEDEYLVISSAKSDLEQVFTSIPELMEELTRLSGQGQKLLSDENIKEMSRMMVDFRSLMVEGKQTMREFKMLAKTLREDPSQLIRGPKYKGYEVQK